MGGQEETVCHLVRRFAEPLVAEMDMELVEVEFRREGHGWVLRLFIDREGGVTLDDCTEVSREVSRYLEVEDPIEHRYHLEVSSPGLERPLRRSEDFQRFTGRRVRIKMREKIGEQRIFTGELRGMDGPYVVVVQQEREYRLPLDGIARARLVYEEP